MLFRSGFSKTKNSLHWLLNVIMYRMPFIPEGLRIRIKHLISHKTNDWLKIKGNNRIELLNKEANSSLLKMSNSVLKLLTIPTLLHYEDRNSMAFSIESRVPFLDYRLVEYVSSLPNNLKIKNAKTKYIFREAMKGILPESIRNRKDKVGFATPQEKWVKDNNTFFRNKLEISCNILSAIIDKDSMLNWFDNSIKNDVSFKYNFWNIICFAHWVKIYNVELSD